MSSLSASTVANLARGESFSIAYSSRPWRSDQPHTRNWWKGLGPNPVTSIYRYWSQLNTQILFIELFLNRDISKFDKPGPIRMLRPALPMRFAQVPAAGGFGGPPGTKGVHCAASE